MDRADQLAGHRDRFILPEGVLYLDGNSLGPLTKAAQARVAEAVNAEWADGLIRSWNTAGWIDLPARIAAKIAPLIGVDAADVAVGDSTSINLFKVLSAALDKAGEERNVILSEPGNFPTDLYIAQGVGALRGAELRLVDDVEAALADDTAVVMVTQVDYRTGAKHDMAALTEKVHAAGAIMAWDLAHSAGAFPVDLAGADADFAIGCGYKYLNGGPGAPAFLWAAPRHQTVMPALRGWFGHAAPFAFETQFRPAEGVKRFITGTAPVLSMTALEAALSAFDGVDLAAIAKKSAALCDLMIELVAARCPSLTLASPRDAAVRGSQVSFRHEGGYAIMQALIARGVIGDFRAPDILRFGMTPLYTRFADVFDAVEILAEILDTGAWDTPEFHRRAAVT
ncbi:kynureninase [Acuticoccus sp. MNP-M23]|uniref:kynureninase n=1 Tax=Acuticoccus sp. MNP-M23 TaxID=3072793 RepID=UPI00281553C3|nr:kynureninase [Acuticoccus sp. MNP-M23]WMS45147.1 kynureninase [Acuticoccus sp. MNP-M23]